MGVVVPAGSQYLNTDSGLTSLVDRLTKASDIAAFNDEQLRGLAPSMAQTGVPISVPANSGILSRLLGAVGIAPQATSMPVQTTSMPQATAAAPATQMAQAPTAGPPVPGFDSAVNRTLGFEGGLNPKDTNGAATNYGINQAANPDVNVASLSPDQAKQIYKDRYWNTIGADQMSPALSRAAFDTAVLAGPEKAKQLVAQSGGDPMKLMDLREQFQQSLLQKDPQKYMPYAKAWANRNVGLRMDIAALNATSPGGATAYAGAQPTAASAPAAQAATQQAANSPAVAPAGASAAAPATQGLGALTPAAIGAMIQSPATRDMGLQLWQQMLTGKRFDFQMTPDGTIVRQDPRTGQVVPVYQGTVKGIPVAPGNALVNPVTGARMFSQPPKMEPQVVNGHVVNVDPANNTATDVTPPTVPGSDQIKAVEAANQNQLDAITKTKDQAVAASRTLDAINRQQTALDKGAFTGGGADRKLAITNTLAGLLGIDNSKVANTQEFLAAANQKAAELARQLSQSGHTTNADLNMGKIIGGADINYSMNALREIGRAQQQLALDAINRHNASVDQAAKYNPVVGQRADFYRVPMPKSIYQFGQPQAAPQAQPGAAPAAPQGAPVKISTPDEAMKLPSGTVFVTPDGRTMVRH